MMLIKDLYENMVARYLFYGVLTVVINLLSFYILKDVLKMNLDVSNFLSILIALLFAYVVNTYCVFHSQVSTRKGKFAEFFKFFTARIFTMVLEIVGVHFMVNIIAIGSFVSKLVMQFIVVLLNYILSKFLVYKR